MAKAIVGDRQLHHIPGASALPAVVLTPSERSQLRSTYLGGQQRLIVFFGFVLEKKGADLLFDIAEPRTDRVVIAGELAAESSYQARLLERAAGEWEGKVTFTGYLSSIEAASLLAVADAVVLPFREGGGSWNSSIHGAVSNGAYVITTTTGASSYDPALNVAYTQIGAIDEMKANLDLAAARLQISPPSRDEAWGPVAMKHLQVYRGVSE